MGREIRPTEVTDYDEPQERGAETIRMPDGTGYALAICDYEQPDGSTHRVITLMEVTADDLDRTIYQREEVVE